jgi:hypothetical protein
MDENDVRSSAQAVCDALVAGDVDTAIGYLSEELKRNIGEVVALLPLPATEVTIESIDRGASAFVVVVRLVGEGHEDLLETRWKDRDGDPRIVEVSHLSRTEPEVGAPGEGDESGEAGEGEAATAQTG